jgi:hypothetical protein
VAQATIIYLTDDLDGSDADETVKFALDGRGPTRSTSSKKNASALCRSLKLYVDAGRSVGRRATTGRRSGSPTLFSQLDSTEKSRFRRWAKMPNARRIADSRVQEWIVAGRP